MTGALDGIRILDLTRLLPGPFCTMLLADLGADVIKIEEPTGGDPARQTPALFAMVNRNKRSIVLDLKQPQDRETLLKLVERSDALVESFRPGVMARLGLDYEVLAQRNPRLVYASMSGFGQSGPYRDRPGHDLNYIALAGLLNYNVDATGKPVVPAAQAADLGGGTLAAVAIMAALLSARATGYGQAVDVSLFASAVTWLPALIGPLFSTGEALAAGEPMLSGGLAQYAVYATADGRYVTLGALEPKFLANFLECVGRPELLRASQPRLRAALIDIFARRTLEEWVRALDGVDTCFAPVNTLDETMRDAQVMALGLLANKQIAPPFVMSRTPATIRRAPPKLGEHNAELLAELEQLSN